MKKQFVSPPHFLFQPRVSIMALMAIAIPAYVAVTFIIFLLTPKFDVSEIYLNRAAHLSELLMVRSGDEAPEDFYGQTAITNPEIQQLAKYSSLVIARDIQEEQQLINHIEYDQKRGGHNSKGSDLPWERRRLERLQKVKAQLEQIGNGNLSVDALDKREKLELSLALVQLDRAASLRQTSYLFSRLRSQLGSVAPVYAAAVHAQQWLEGKFK